MSRSRWIIILGALVLQIPLWSGITSGQPINLGMLSNSIISGNYSEIADDDNVAYIATGYGVRMMDITNPAEPSEIAHIPTDGLAKSVSVSGDYLFVCDFGNGLLAYDISDLYNPVFLDKLELVGGLRSARPFGNYLYVAAEEYGVQIVDWSDPENLELVDILYTGGETFQTSTFDHWLYVSMGEAGLGVYDISDPVAPELQLIWNTTGGKALDACLFPTQDALTLADYGNGVYILDLTYPWIPTWTATMSESSFVATHVASLGTVGVCSYMFQGVQTFNLSGNVLDYLDLGGACGGVFDVGNYLYVAGGDSGLLVVNAENPADLILENTVQDYDQVFNVCINGDIAYLANSLSGLRTMDISDRENPISLGSIPTSYLAKDVIMHPTEDYLYLCDFGVGIRTYDISNPASPTLVNTAPTNPDTAAHSLLYHDGHLYVANYLRGLNVFDLSIPAAPELIYTTPDSVAQLREIAITEDGTHLLACAESSGLLVYRLYQPDSIVYQYSLEEFDLPFDILIKENYAYLADFDGGFYVLDVSNPYYIFKVDSLPGLNAISGVTLIDENHLAICDWTAGVAVVDITDPTDIFEVDRHETPGFAFNARSDGDYLYVADTYSFTILDLYAPAAAPGDRNEPPPNQITLQPAYPNPFNAATSITFNLVMAADMQLSVYDIGGSKVAQLLNGRRAAGTHHVNFRAEGLASGLYFIRLEAGNAIQTQKVLLVK